MAILLEQIQRMKLVVHTVSFVLSLPAKQISVYDFLKTLRTFELKQKEFLLAVQNEDSKIRKVFADQILLKNLSGDYIVPTSWDEFFELALAAIKHGEKAVVKLKAPSEAASFRRIKSSFQSFEKFYRSQDRKVMHIIDALAKIERTFEKFLSLDPHYIKPKRNKMFRLFFSKKKN